MGYIFLGTKKLLSPLLLMIAALQKNWIVDLTHAVDKYDFYPGYYNYFDVSV